MHATRSRSRLLNYTRCRFVTGLAIVIVIVLVLNAEKISALAALITAITGLIGVAAPFLQRREQAQDRGPTRRRENS
jgi:hypothetical protein